MNKKTANNKVGLIFLSGYLVFLLISVILSFFATHLGLYESLLSIPGIPLLIGLEPFINIPFYFINALIFYFIGKFLSKRINNQILSVGFILLISLTIVWRLFTFFTYDPGLITIHYVDTSSQDVDGCYEIMLKDILPSYKKRFIHCEFGSIKPTKEEGVINFSASLNPEYDCACKVQTKGYSPF